MKLKIIVVGKTKENYLGMGEEDFKNRIKKYIRLEWIVVKQERITAKGDERKIKDIEGERIKQKIGHGELVIVLDNSGLEMSSERFAEFIQYKMLSGLKYITFIVGGPIGLNDEVIKGANVKLSLSKMTFTHEMSRLILLEQIYRGFTIIKGEKYHK